MQTCQLIGALQIGFVAKKTGAKIFQNKKIEKEVGRGSVRQIFHIFQLNCFSIKSYNTLKKPKTTPAVIKTLPTKNGCHSKIENCALKGCTKQHPPVWLHISSVQVLLVPLQSLKVMIALENTRKLCQQVNSLFYKKKQ